MVSVFTSCIRISSAFLFAKISSSDNSVGSSSIGFVPNASVSNANMSGSGRVQIFLMLFLHDSEGLAWRP